MVKQLQENPAADFPEKNFRSFTVGGLRWEIMIYRMCN
jgi:hypothetical protein